MNDILRQLMYAKEEGVPIQLEIIDIPLPAQLKAQPLSPTVLRQALRQYRAEKESLLSLIWKATVDRIFRTLDWIEAHPTVAMVGTIWALVIAAALYFPAPVQ